MDTLILVGLLAIGALALVGLVFVLRTERHVETKPTKRITEVMPADTPASVPAVTKTTHGTVNRPLMEMPDTPAKDGTDHVQDIPSSTGTRRATQPLLRESGQRTIPAEQIQAFSTELRSLQHHATELEQRLNQLTTMAEQLADSHNGEGGATGSAEDTATLRAQP